MEMYRFDEADRPEVLTGILPECERGEHDKCKGVDKAVVVHAMGAREETVFCVCSCHEETHKT